MDNSNLDKLIFIEEGNGINIEVLLEDETIWLTQSQMATLFNKDRNTINDHIIQIYEESELERNSTYRKFRLVQTEGLRQVTRTIDHYNLDVIISVGYRVKSKQGTQFRIWANKILKEYLINGYVLNQKKLESERIKYESLQSQLKTLRKVYENEQFSLSESKELIRIITDYANGLNLLEKFDKSAIEIYKPKRKANSLNYLEAVNNITELRISLKAGSLFGNEKDDGFKSALQTIFQTFEEKDLYPSIEEKAANLLYLIIKNHPFTDGNKRIGAFMFVRFLDLNKLLYKSDGTRSIEENTLVAIALLIAQSDRKDKQQMINLVVNLIQI